GGAVDGQDDTGLLRRSQGGPWRVEVPRPGEVGRLEHFQVRLDERLRVVRVLLVHPDLGCVAGLAVLRFRRVGGHVDSCGDAAGAALSVCRSDAIGAAVATATACAGAGGRGAVAAGSAGTCVVAVGPAGVAAGAAAAAGAGAGAGGSMAAVAAIAAILHQAA